MIRQLVLWLLLLVTVSSVPASAGRIELLSKKGTLGPAKAVGTAAGYDMSADGRFVTFASTSPNLVPGQSDGNNGADIFLWDRTTGETRLVSHRSGSATVASNGAAADYPAPRISADGRWIAFCSSGTNLMAGEQTTRYTNVYLHDRLTDTTTLVSRSIASPLLGGNYDSCLENLALSSDGRYLTFNSEARDLVAPADPTWSHQVYLYDRETAQLTLVSHAAGNGAQRANDNSRTSSISADGRWIVYESAATDLVAGLTDGNNAYDVFLFDRTTGLNVLVSHASGSLTTAAGASFPEISADGAWVVYSSISSNLVTGQTDGIFTTDVFLWERTTGTTRLVSHTPGSTTTTGNGDSGGYAISSDGSWIAFDSSSTDLVAGATDGNDAFDLFLFERSTGTNTLVSHAAGSAATANGSSGVSVLSPDGGHLLFSSRATDLLPGMTDANGAPDLFTWNRATGSVTLVSHAQGSATTAGNEPTFTGALSGDGLFVAFSSSATNLAGATDTNEGTDVFVHDLGSGANTALSYSPPVITASANGNVDYLHRLITSADGRFIVFQSAADDLVPGQVDANDGGNDTFLYDRETGLTTLVSHSASSSSTTTGNDSSYEAVISRDGRFVAYSAWATDLVAGQTDVGKNVFLFDRLLGSTIVVSHAVGSPTQGRYCEFVKISGDGRFVAFLNDNYLFLFDREADTLTPIHPWVFVTAVELSTDGRYLAFTSNATNIVPGQSDSNGSEDRFLYDRISGTTVLASRSASSPTTAGNAQSFAPGAGSLSADGRFVLIQSSATDLVPGQVDTNGQPDYFLFDRVTGAVSLVTHAFSSPTTTANAATYWGALSQDGRFVTFMTNATNLVPGQQNAAPGGVFLFDRLSGNVSLVSHVAGSLTTSGGGRLPAISGDGSRIVFVSPSTELIAGIQDSNSGEDVYLYDRSSGSLELVSHALGSPGITGNAPANPVATLSEDGRTVVFTSGASDHVANDFNLHQDIFAFVPEDLDFYTLAPCRLFDSRRPEDGPALTAGVATIVEVNGACGVPTTARALAVNVTVIEASSLGYLTLYPGDGLPPVASTLNFLAGLTRANNALVRLAPSGNGTLAVRPMINGGGSVHVIIDVVGFFE